MRTIALLLALAGAARAENAFVGNYGTVLTYPSDYVASPQMGPPEGAVEYVNIGPAACSGPTPECLPKIFQLMVMPYAVIERYNGIKGFEAYVGAAIKESEGNGEGPSVVRFKDAAIPAFKVSLASPKASPFDTYYYLGGKKYVYRVNCLHGNAVAEKVAASLEGGAAKKPAAKGAKKRR